MAGFESAFLLVLAFVGVIFVGLRGIRGGFLYFIALFGIGYRTFEVVRYVRLHPAEILIWALFLFLIVPKMILNKEKMKYRVPQWLWVFAIFWFFALIVGFGRGYSGILMFAEFRLFLILLPLFGVVAYILSDESNWYPTISLFFLTGTVVALLGVIEFYYPGISNLVPSFFSPVVYITPDGFTRASFSFWGTPAATFLLVLSIPFALILWNRTQKLTVRSLLTIAVLIQVGGIYIGGYRSLWLMFAMQMILWGVIYLGIFRGIILLIPTLAVFSSIPVETSTRALSIVSIARLETYSLDSSALKRIDWFQGAWESVFRNPIGAGWSAAGWPHSDFLQVAVNQGALAGVLFLGAWVFIVIRVARRIRRYSKQEEEYYYGWAFLLSLLGVGGLLAFQSVVILPQLVLPVWLIWIMVEIWLQQLRGASQ